MTESLALYRRYRPDTFEDVIGQEHVTKSLQSALANGRVNHAYLFSGPRGCGKTTSARIMARCLNCHVGPTATPCGKCPSCLDLANGGPGSIDVIEIDAASHNKVEEARELRERAAYAPARDRFKIFILDEAHMVTPAGFNALLKLVEEPPDHIKFIFATTEPEKVMGTIRSRTHHYPFRLVAPEILQRYLAQLCEREGVAIEDGVLGLVLRAGGGSVRDSLSILDQLIAGENEAVLHYDRAVALLGYTDATMLSSFVGALITGSGADAYAVVDRMMQNGNEPRRFVEDLLQYLRNLVILKLSGDMRVLGDVPEGELLRMRPQAESLGGRVLTHLAEVVNEGLTAISGASSPRLSLELLVAQLLMAVGGAGLHSEAAAKEPPAAAREPMNAVKEPVGAANKAEEIPVENPVLAASPNSPAKAPATFVDKTSTTSIEQNEDKAIKPAATQVIPSGNNWFEKPERGTESAPSATPEPVPHPISEPVPVSSLSQPTSSEVPPVEQSSAISVSAQMPAPVASVPAVAGVDSYQQIHSCWGDIMLALQQNSRNAANIVSTHARLQGMRGDTLEIALENKGMVTAFMRYAADVAQAIGQVTGISVHVVGVESGFGAPKGSVTQSPPVESARSSSAQWLEPTSSPAQAPELHGDLPTAPRSEPLPVPEFSTPATNSDTAPIPSPEVKSFPTIPGKDMAQAVLGGTFLQPEQHGKKW